MIMDPKVKKGFWMKGDGTILKIADMEDIHIIHVLEMYKREALEGYADPNQDEMAWMEGSLSPKFFELQYEAYKRDILPEDALILDTSTPEEYIPEGMNVGIC